MKEVKRKKKGWQRLLCVLGGVLAFVVGVLSLLQLGCVYTERTWTHWRPDYAKVDISPIVYSEDALTEEEYDLLYHQTGLTKLAVDDMREDMQGRAKILTIQEVFFADYKVKSRRFNPYTYLEELDGGRTELCDLKDGDIIITSTTRVTWYRYGHATLVVDGENKRIAESLGPGVKSNVNKSASTLTNLANFIVLRPKVDEAVKAEVVNYVKTEMSGIEYDIFRGIFSEKFPEKLTSTQCAHFVWYAYKKFGVDLDSTGGAVVKPRDMFLSDQVEIVQAYGFDPDTLWG